MNYSANKYFKFCPHCGRQLSIKKEQGVPQLACRKCGFVFYQNSKPTVSAFFIDKLRRIMMVKRAISPKKGWWDAPGGFLENGEEPVSGLRREISEELGVSIKDIKFFGIYLDTYEHGYTLHTLNIIYLAQISSGKIRPMDDVCGYRRFSKNQIPWSKLAFPWLKKSLKDWVKTR